MLTDACTSGGHSATDGLHTVGDRPCALTTSRCNNARDGYSRYQGGRATGTSLVSQQSPCSWEWLTFTVSRLSGADYLLYWGWVSSHQLKVFRARSFGASQIFPDTASAENNGLSQECAPPWAALYHNRSTGIQNDQAGPPLKGQLPWTPLETVSLDCSPTSPLPNSAPPSPFHMN